MRYILAETVVLKETLSTINHCYMMSLIVWYLVQDNTLHRILHFCEKYCLSLNIPGHVGMMEHDTTVLTQWFSVLCTFSSKMILVPPYSGRSTLSPTETLSGTS